MHGQGLGGTLPADVTFKYIDVWTPASVACPSNLVRILANSGKAPLDPEIVKAAKKALFELTIRTMKATIAMEAAVAIDVSICCHKRSRNLSFMLIHRYELGSSKGSWTYSMCSPLTV